MRKISTSNFTHRFCVWQKSNQWSVRSE